MPLREILKLISKHEIVSVFDMDSNSFIVEDVENNQLDVNHLPHDKKVKKITSYNAYKESLVVAAIGVFVGGE